MNSNSTIKRVTIVGSIFNVLLSLLKLVGGYLFHSAALIADGVHSFSDLITDFVVLFGVKFWSKDADEEHPYGHGRIETFITLFIGVFLVGVALFMVVGAINGMIDYEPYALSWLTFAIALFSIGVKEALYRYGSRAGKKVNSRALLANAWHHRSDAISSVPVALAVVVSKVFPNLMYLDQIATILVSIFLFRAAYDIIRGSFEEFMEKRDDVDLAPLLTSCRTKHPEIKDFHKVNIRRVGSFRFVDLHMLVLPSMTVEASHNLSGAVKGELMASNYEIKGVIVHIEPYYI